MSTFRLSRRTILKGIGGAMVGLPALEIMSPDRARAAESPRRFVLIYGGVSMGADQHPTLVTPDEVGTGYDLKRALLPLGAGALPSNPGLGGQGYDVQEHASVVSGLKIPWDTGSGVPLGGKSKEFHYNTSGPQLSGMRGNASREERPNGPTADQIVADSFAGLTPHHSLSYRVQAASYVGTNSSAGSAASRISYRKKDGKLQAIDPIFSPQLAFSTLFGKPIPSDPAQAASAELFLRRHKSVIDLVRERTEWLAGKLGTEDRARMERHLDEIRALEKRLESVPAIGGSCQQPMDPGDDPPVAGAAIEYQGNGGGGTGYSNEELRATNLFNLIAMAFACDLTRVAAVRMTYSQCFLQMKELIGFDGDVHSAIGHNDRQVPYADCIGWHVKHFARFLALLRDTPEVDGSSLLDHTAVVMLFEGGLGYDPESDTGPLRGHSTENMIGLIGGHAGGLNAGGGKHIVKTNWHPSQVVISAMKAVGVAEDDETLGEVTGAIPDLFT